MRASFLRKHLLLLFFAPGLILQSATKTPLDDYVAAPDSNYRYEMVKTITGKGYRAFVLDMTSQAWRSKTEVDRTLWRHWVNIVKPDGAKPGTALMFIGGGSNEKNDPPDKVDPRLAGIAMATRSVVAEVRMVPNQPITFLDDPEREARKEDSLIAYGMLKYLKGGDSQWVARLPMTKSAVRAMDTVSAFLAGDGGGGLKIDRYVVSGASKRGWTTWTTGAVDPRVTGIMPLVIDVLNNEASMRHHWRAYGFWAPAVGDYLPIFDRYLGAPKLAEIAKIEDPYEYRDRLTMPKYVINAAGDQYFLPDSSRFYFDDLKGEKYLRYIPNTDHSLDKSDVVESMTAFYQSLIDAKPRPRFSWQFEKDGTIRVKTEDKPSAVKLWFATNAKARDFRLESIGPAYESRELKPDSTRGYIGQVAKPGKGWTAYFVELTFPASGKYPFKFTTAVRVTPDTLPFPDPKPKR